jgi:Tol biopolymer transport system component
MGTGDEWFPSWSRDGRTIYFSADGGRGWDIWRVPTTGGIPERVTFTGNAGKGFESADRTRLVYQERFPPGQVGSDPMSPTRILLQPLKGGEPAEVVRCATGGSLSAGPNEFYYADCGKGPSAHALDIDTGTKRFLAPLDAFSSSSIAVRATREGAEILYTRHNAAGVDVFLIDNFK